MPPIVGIQFSPTGKQYHFDAKGITDLIPGDRVVVETSRGRQLGVVTGYIPKQALEGRSCKPIERRATARDLIMQQQFQAKALNALVSCRQKAENLGLAGYKFVKAEYNYDGSQVTILYSTEKKSGNLDALKRELRRAFRTRVELFQIGPRDIAKQLDGLGACGAQRCCSRFLTKFDSVSIRMAKLQHISLTPSEITGMCGRLRCCLAYEQELYAEASTGLPNRGKTVITPYGKGRVVEVRTLAGVVVVEVDGVRHNVQKEDIGKKQFTTPPPTSEPWPSWLPGGPSIERSKQVEKPGEKSKRDPHSTKTARVYRQDSTKKTTAKAEAAKRRKPKKRKSRSSRQKRSKPRSKTS